MLMMHNLSSNLFCWVSSDCENCFYYRVSIKWHVSNTINEINNIEILMFVRTLIFLGEIYHYLVNKIYIYFNKFQWNFEF